MKRIVILMAALVSCSVAQVPGFGWCPDYSPMADFDLNRYMGVWYEAERYFTVLEAGSRCVRSNYTKGIDGKFRVSNEITNRLTGIRRVLDGVVQNIGKGGEGKITVKYNTLPVPVDTQYSVLDTDYDTYSVVWSCSSLGPINTQNAWVMTRERLAPGTVLQHAYGILDKYRISRTFFVKTDQSDCIFTDPSAVPPDPVENDKKKDESSNKVRGSPVTTEVKDDKPIKESAKKPVKESVKESVKEPVKEPTKEPTKEPVKESTKEPAKQPAKQPAEQPANEPAKDHVEPNREPVLVETLNADSTQVPVVPHQAQNAPKPEPIYLKPLKEPVQSVQHPATANNNPVESN